MLGVAPRQAFLHPPPGARPAGKGAPGQPGSGGGGINMWAHVPMDAAQKGALGRIRTLWRGVGARAPHAPCREGEEG